jgi:hypothetical protein
MPEETNAIVEAWLTGKPVPDYSPSRQLEEKIT